MKIYQKPKEKQAKPNARKLQKKEGYLFRRKSKDEDKEGMQATTIAQTTEAAVTISGTKQAVTPTSLKDATKENQTCTTKKQQPKEMKT